MTQSRSYQDMFKKGRRTLMKNMPQLTRMFSSLMDDLIDEMGDSVSEQEQKPKERTTKPENPTNYPTRKRGGN